jgi:hypothetical protein
MKTKVAPACFALLASQLPSHFDMSMPRIVMAALQDFFTVDFQIVH